MSRPGWFEREHRLRQESRLLGECKRCGAKAGYPCRRRDDRGSHGIRRAHSGRERLTEAQAVVVELRQEREVHEAIQADAKRRREGKR